MERRGGEDEIESHDIRLVRSLSLPFASDGADLYASEHERILKQFFPKGFNEIAAAEVFGRYLLGENTSNYEELTENGRQRIFNLGYFTWVEQQHVPIEAFEARRSQGWWREMRASFTGWDEAIRAFNTA